MQSFTRLLGPPMLIPNRWLSDAVTLRTVLRELNWSAIPMPKPVTRPFLTTVEMRAAPTSVTP